MFDRNAPRASATTPANQLPEPPAIADAVDRLDFGRVFHNEVTFPEA